MKVEKQRIKAAIRALKKAEVREWQQWMGFDKEPFTIREKRTEMIFRGTKYDVGIDLTDEWFWIRNSDTEKRWMYNKNSAAYKAARAD